jgi:hypothetical protein
MILILINYNNNLNKITRRTIFFIFIMSNLTKQSKRRRNSYWSSDSDSKELISCSDCSTDYSSSFDIKSSHCGKDCNRKECNSSNSSESESNSIKSTEDQNFINGGLVSWG